METRIKLLVVTVFNDRSEVEVYRQMASCGHQVHVVVDPKWTGAAPLEAAGIRVSRLKIRHRLDWRAARAVKSLIQEMIPDVIYAPRNRSLAVSLMASRSGTAPVVGYRGTIGHLSRWDPASWLTYLHPKLAHIICVSEAVRLYLLKMRIPTSKLTTLYKGHRLAWYTEDMPCPLTSFGVPDDAFVVGFTGNIRPVKGVDVLLKSLAFIPPELNVHICLIGEVRDRAVTALCRQAGIVERVHLAGFQPDASRFCGGFDVFVMPSVEREGLPRAVIEAMARQIPPIVSNAGGMPELVENGVSGIVVPTRDPQALAAAISEMARSPALRTRYGENARKRVESVFNVDVTAAKMMTLFTRLSANEPVCSG